MSNNPDHRFDATVSQTGANVSADRAHITSDELARALAVIEARKNAAASPPAVTGLSEETAENRDSDITPEQLLAEAHVLRQKPVSASEQLAPLTHCPACSRKLLTQASALCNWCGAIIDDPKYQERAALSRQELDQAELSQLETLVQEETRYGIFGRLKRRAKELPSSKKSLG